MEEKIIMSEEEKLKEFKEWLGEDNKLGYDICIKKYRYKDESLDEMMNRLSAGDDDLKLLIYNKQFLFGGRTMTNRGTDRAGSYSNCYSRGFIEDDFTDIMNSLKDIGLTYKAQGGQGVSLSKIRPKGCGINKGQYKSDGIINIMDMLNNVTKNVSQGGARKGALLISLDINHPQAKDFILAKSKSGELEKANLSLEIDDNFMKIIDGIKNENIEPYGVMLSRDYSGNNFDYSIDYEDLFNTLAETSYNWAEPGVIFTDRFRNYNLMEFCDDYKIETCNPCGEQPLPKHGCCNLGSINLAEFVLNPFYDNAVINWRDLEFAVRVAVRALDEVVDENANNHPLKEQRDMARNYRNIGLGVMGLWDMFCKLGVKYGSDKSIALARDIMNFIFHNAFIASYELAKEKGSFPMYSDKLFDSKIFNQVFSTSDYYNPLTDKELEDMKEVGLRNCSLLSIAPTGSIANLLGVSNGCEPIFALSYNRKTRSLNGGEDVTYTAYPETVRFYREVFNKEELPDYFVTASEINWKDRIKLQGALQESVDTSISSTVNLPEDCTVDEVKELYIYAWKQGLKGVTIFREGSSREAILTKDDKDKKKVNSKENILENGYETLKINENPSFVLPKICSFERVSTDIAPLRNDCIGKTRHLMSGCGTIHLTANFNPEDGTLHDIYINKGSKGGCKSHMVAMSRMVSLNARAGVSIDKIIDQLHSTDVCGSYTNRTRTKRDTSKGTSCPDAISYALKEMYDEVQYEIKRNKTYEKYLRILENRERLTNNQFKHYKYKAYPKKLPTEKSGSPTIKPTFIMKDSIDHALDNKSKNICPECGEELPIRESGCATCVNCGWNACE